MIMQAKRWKIEELLFYDCCDYIYYKIIYIIIIVRFSRTQKFIINITIKCQLSIKTIISFTKASLIHIMIRFTFSIKLIFLAR